MSTFHTPMKLKLVSVKRSLKTESLEEGEPLLKLPQPCRLHSSHSSNVYSHYTVLRGATMRPPDTTNHNFSVQVLFFSNINTKLYSWQSNYVTSSSIYVSALAVYVCLKWFTLNDVTEEVFCKILSHTLVCNYPISWKYKQPYCAAV